MSDQTEKNTPLNDAEANHLMAWLKAESRRVVYGEVGVILTLHQGKITHVKKISEIKEKRY